MDLFIQSGPVLRARPIQTNSNVDMVIPENKTNET